MTELAGYDLLVNAIKYEETYHSGDISSGFAPYWIGYYAVPSDSRVLYDVSLEVLNKVTRGTQPCVARYFYSGTPFPTLEVFFKGFGTAHLVAETPMNKHPTWYSSEVAWSGFYQVLYHRAAYRCHLNPSGLMYKSSGDPIEMITIDGWPHVSYVYEVTGMGEPAPPAPATMVFYRKEVKSNSFGIMFVAADDRITYSSASVTWNQLDYVFVPANTTISKGYTTAEVSELRAVVSLLNTPSSTTRCIAPAATVSGKTVTVTAGNVDAYLIVLGK